MSGSDDAVTIGICTFRRPSLFEALASIAAQEEGGPRPVEIVVVDNDDHDGLRTEVDRFAGQFSLPLRYVHAPARNISIARNATLDAATTRWLAFIDDDETATPSWLARLMAGRGDAEAVIGQCTATYDDALPGWAARCDFHSNRIGGDAANAYTSNALLDMHFIRRHGLRFREELGRTGGEDTLFFRQIAELGGRIVYRPDALVYEPVPPARASMRWVCRRKYRSGQTHGLLCRTFDRRAYDRLLLTAGGKAAASLAMAVATLPGSDRSRQWFARAVLHLGAARYRLSPRILEEYG